MNVEEDYFKYHNRKRTVKAQAQWLENQFDSLPLSVCWHVPNAMKHHYHGYDEIWLSKELRRYFNNVDRRIFKAAHKNKGTRLRRIITLERDENVGWHAHGLVAAAPDLDEQQTRQILRDEWIKYTKRFATDKFDKRLFYGEIDRGRSLGYITKHIHNNEDGSKGFLDLQNNYIPQ